MTLGDNPAGHGFVLRKLVLIELSGYFGARGEGGLKSSEKSLGGGPEMLIVVGKLYCLGGELGNFVGGGRGESRKFEIKIKTA